MPSPDGNEGAALSIDLFGTLVAVDPPPDPAAAVAAALRERDVSVPSDWHERYASPTADVPEGVERSLYDHVEAALTAGRDADAERGAIERAVDAAFDPSVVARDGAATAVAAASESGPVGVLSNTAVPGLATRAVERASLPGERIDAVVTSVGCGWRKPDPRAFRAVADALSVPASQLIHVGDDPATDGGAPSAGARFVSIEETPLESVPTMVEGRP